MRYERQLSFKQERLTQGLQGVLGANAAVRACVSALPASLHHEEKGETQTGLAMPLGYRSRVKLVAATRLSRDATGTARSVLYLGSYVPRTHSVLSMEGCQVHAPGLTDVARTLTAALNHLGVRAYDEASGQGALRYVLLRESKSGEQQLGLVVAERPSAGCLAQLCQTLVQAHPRLVSVVLHHNRSPGNALLSSEDPEQSADLADEPLHGEPYLWEEVAGLPLRISARSFFQVHRDIAARIYSDVASLLRSHLAADRTAEPQQIVDVYCGVGGLGLGVLSQLPHSTLLGVESSESAIADARNSAARQGVSERATFLCGSAEALLVQPGVIEQAKSASALLLNPPRRGCTKEVLAALLRLRPRHVVYVSCSAESLARDLSALVAAGYAWVQSTPYDMHPGTPHIESVTLLRDAK
jgi:23S rRNA (uracil1939-C5)-methyltransferase